MPILKEIHIENFRNLGSIQIEPSPHLNIFIGPNGAGKTSLLESICVLSQGRSFRTNKYKHLIKKEKDSYLLRTKFLDSVESTSLQPLGIQRFTNGNLTIKFNNEFVRSSSELAKQMPIVVITGESFKLLEEGPKERRKFLDWLVFHVKPEFIKKWQEVVRCYKQRNTLLRRGKITYETIAPWDREIASLSVQIQELRYTVFELFKNSFQRLAAEHKEYSFLNNSSFVLKSGWREENTDGKDLIAQLTRQLEESFERDLKIGYSSLGPQKADLKVIQTDHAKQLSKDVLSRGQQKTLICTMYYALANVFRELNGTDPMVLVDDLPAELDINNQRYLSRWLDSVESQVFISGIDKSFLDNIWGKKDLLQLKVFHVEHGTISE